MNKIVPIHTKYLDFYLHESMLIDFKCYFPLMNVNCVIEKEEIYFYEEDLNNSVFIGVLKESSLISTMNIPDYIEILYIKETKDYILFIFEVENTIGVEFFNAYSFLMEYMFEVI